MNHCLQVFCCLFFSHVPTAEHKSQENTNRIWFNVQFYIFHFLTKIKRLINCKMILKRCIITMCCFFFLYSRGLSTPIMSNDSCKITLVWVGASLWCFNTNYIEQKWKRNSTDYVFLCTWINKDYKRCLDCISQTSN